MKCPTIERWNKKGLLENMEADKLILHWKNCKICQRTIKQALLRNPNEDQWKKFLSNPQQNNGGLI